ncbi:hypothetical protein HJFPF1_09397 [Paramyrothecium foliicola]|nr:hypothetical protein HJFPF1_09397 [Paramyrothecium foliicola]
MAPYSPPMYTDTPLVPMSTPKFLTGKDDPFTLEASKMAISHNAFIRGFNSIYQQAPRVQFAGDKSDFVGYCIAWHDCVEAHHRYEESSFFPKVDEAAGKTGLMDGAVREHALFHRGMENFKTYLLDKGLNFSSTELIHIMDSFRDPLDAHFRAEITMIVGLAEHSTLERPIDILTIADAAARSQITPSLVLNVIPIFYLNMNTAEFEDGMWDGVFPSYKGTGRAFMTKVIPRWHARRWREREWAKNGITHRYLIRHIRVECFDLEPFILGRRHASAAIACVHIDVDDEKVQGAVEFSSSLKLK